MGIFKLLTVALLVIGASLTGTYFGANLTKGNFNLLSTLDRIETTSQTVESNAPFMVDFVNNSETPLMLRAAPPKINTSPKKKIIILTLEKKNTLIFNQVVRSPSVAKFQQKLMTMSLALPKRSTIYLVLYTPGGSVPAGMQMIDNLKAVPQRIVTITLFAASMGFQIVQNMNSRYITPSGVLMSHRAYIRGLSGQIFGEADSRLESIKKRITYMDLIASKRMSLSLSQYRKLTKDEYWTFGFEAVGEKAADKMILVRCGKSMKGTYKETVRSMFGSFILKFAKCPIITAPVDVDMSLIAKDNKEKVKNFIDILYNNPREFYKEYIKTDTYIEMLPNN